MLELILFVMLLWTALEQNSAWCWTMFGIQCAIIVIEIIVKYLENILDEQGKGE